MGKHLPLRSPMLTSPAAGAAEATEAAPPAKPQQPEPLATDAPPRATAEQTRAAAAATTPTTDESPSDGSYPLSQHGGLGLVGGVGAVRGLALVVVVLHAAQVAVLGALQLSVGEAVALGAEQLGVGGLEGRHVLALSGADPQRQGQVGSCPKSILTT